MAAAFTSTAKYSRAMPVSIRSSRLFEREKDNNPFGFLFNPYESTIPEEIRKEIYEAEANTPAAKDRSQRIALYSVVAFVGVLGAFFNGFLTELRSGDEGVLLSEAGFGWVESNFLFKFLFLNKIGGVLLLLGGKSWKYVYLPRCWSFLT